MSSSSYSTVYLISGANRGLGLGLVAKILAKHPDAFVYAGVRDPVGPSASDLRALEGTGRLAVVKLVSADVEGNKDVAEYISRRHGRLDTVIANAAIGHSMESVADVPPSDLDEHFHVNVTGTIVLFQAVQHLLRKSLSPRFVPISSSAGRLTGMMIQAPFKSVAYSASKAALNWATRKMHFENEWLVAFPICPGAVDTDMMRTNASRDTTGMFEKMQKAIPKIPTPEEAAEAVLGVVDTSTRETHGGLFYDQKGAVLGW